MKKIFNIFAKKKDGKNLDNNINKNATEKLEEKCEKINQSEHNDFLLMSENTPNKTIIPNSNQEEKEFKNILNPKDIKDVDNFYNDSWKKADLKDDEKPEITELEEIWEYISNLLNSNFIDFSSK